MGAVRDALKMQSEAQRRRALAPAHDSVRRGFELGLADRLDEEAQALLTPPEPLKKALGGEIIPRVEDGLPGLESVLQEPDMLGVETSQQRMHLLERAGALELGIEAAQQANATNAIEKMLCHQIAALHRRALTLLAESEGCKDHDLAVKKARAAARMVDATSRAALTVQRLQGGGNQLIQVEHINVIGQAVIGQSGGEAKKLQNDIHQTPKNRGGRPPTSGDRTAKAIAQRRADSELLRTLQQASGSNL